MTTRTRARIIWAAVILALLAGVYVIVSRNGPRAPGPAAAGYLH